MMPGPMTVGASRKTAGRRRRWRMRRQHAGLSHERAIDQEVVICINRSIEIKIAVGIAKQLLLKPLSI